MQYSHALRKARKSRKMSETQLAEHSSLAKNHITQLENGCNSPTLRTMRKLAKGLGYELQVSMSRQGDSIKIDGKYNPLVD